MNLKYFLGIVCFLGIISCRDSQSDKPKFTPKRDTKSVTIHDFSSPDLSPQSEQTVREWWEFKSLYQVLISIAPKQNQSVKILKYTNPDSLYVFKRMYINSSHRELINARIDINRIKGELLSDTIYQFIKNQKDDFASLSWDEILLADIPYTFSFRAKSSLAENIKIDVVRQKDRKTIREQIIRLDSLDKNILQPYVKLDTLPDNWIKISTQVETPLYGNYTFSIGYNNRQEVNKYISLYRAELLIPIKYKSEIEKSSEKLVQNVASVKSSYDGIYFWLFQVEDELRQLWGRKNIPQKINIPQVTSRLKLFETYVRELSDNVKNNSELTENDILVGIERIKESFASVIDYINILHQDDLDQRMQTLLDEYPNPILEQNKDKENIQENKN